MVLELNIQSTSGTENINKPIVNVFHVFEKT